MKPRGFSHTKWLENDRGEERTGILKEATVFSETDYYRIEAIRKRLDPKTRLLSQSEGFQMTDENAALNIQRRHHVTSNMLSRLNFHHHPA